MTMKVSNLLNSLNFSLCFSSLSRKFQFDLSTIPEQFPVLMILHKFQLIPDIHICIHVN